MSPTDLAGLSRAVADADSTSLADPRDVTVDDALIAPDGWRSVDLASVDVDAPGQGGPLMITARFGLQAMMAGNDNPAAEAAPAETTLPDVSEIFLSGGAVANDDFQSAPRHAPVLRRLRRVVRAERSDLGESSAFIATERTILTDVAVARAAADAVPETGFVAQEPLRVMPMPVHHPVDWQAMRRMVPQRKPQGLDKASIHTLVVIMVGVWLAVVGFGAYKLSTPTYGAKILWER